MGSVSIKTKKRLLAVFIILAILVTALAFRTGWLQVVRGEELKTRAMGQQTRDVPIEAKRGTIYDINMEELAVSARSFSCWVRPSLLWRGKDDVEKEVNAIKTMEKLSPLLDMSMEDIRELAYKDKVIVRIAKYLDKETADAIKESSLYGVEITEESRRYYPMGAFASQLIGSVTDDNVGLSGLEAYYDSYLSGIRGRWIKNVDAEGNGLSFGVERYYEEQDGLDLVLSVDSVIQHYVEKSMEEVLAQTKAERVWCLVMDPETAEVMAMAALPEFDFAVHARFLEIDPRLSH